MWGCQWQPGSSIGPNWLIIFCVWYLHKDSQPRAQARQSVRILLSPNFTRNSSPEATNILFCKDHLIIIIPFLWFYFPCFTMKHFFFLFYRRGKWSLKELNELCSLTRKEANGLSGSIHPYSVGTCINLYGHPKVGSAAGKLVWSEEK